MEHILSLSYGKDSLACLFAIEQLGWPLDRIIHAEDSFNNADWDELKKIFGGTISKDLGKVTNAQFIATLAKEVRRQVYG